MNKMSDELRLIVVSALMGGLIAARVQASEAEKHLKNHREAFTDENGFARQSARFSSPAHCGDR